MRSLPVLAFLYGVYVATILTVLDAADPKAPNVKCLSGACTIEYDFVTSTTTTEPEIKRKEDTDAYTFKNGDKIEIEKDADVFFVYNDGSFTKGKKAAAVTDVDVTNVLTPAWGMAGKTITITHTDDSTPITVRSKMTKNGLLELQLEYYVNKFQERDATKPKPPIFRKPEDGALEIIYDYMKKLKIDDATKARTEYFIHTTLKFEDQDVIEINKEPRITSGTFRFKHASTDKYTYNCGDESTLPWFTKAGKEDHISVPSMMNTLVKAWGKGKGTTTDPHPLKKMKIGRSIRILDKDGAIVRLQLELEGRMSSSPEPGTNG